MAKYREIKGVTIQTLDSDPVVNVGSWSAGGSTNVSRDLGAGAGTQTAALSFGGQAPAIQATNEQYDGSSWTEVGDLNQGRSYLGGTGTTTAALAVAGYSGSADYDLTETWNGSAWTEVGDINTGRSGIGTGGSTTAGLIWGGYDETPPNQTTLTESWNGSAWTEVADLNVEKYNVFFGGGTQTNALCIGGTDGSSVIAQVERWDGSSWTEISDLNTARTHGGTSGIYTAMLAFGGDEPSKSAKTESWDGTSWTEVNDLATARRGGTGTPAGTNALALYAAGYSGSYVTSTEEWAFPPPTSAILTEGDIFLSGGTALKGFGTAAGIPAATWASGGSLNSARTGLRGAGISQDSALAFGGSSPGVLTESYNGTTWTEVNDLSTTITTGVGVGTQSAARAAMTTTNQGWDGTSWSEENNLNTSRQEIGSLGTKASCLAIGNQNGASGIVEQWDGTNWTEVGDLTTSVGSTMGIGTTSSGRAVGGWNPPNYKSENQFWNGTSWSEEADINTARYAAGASGSSTLGLIFGGYGPNVTGKTEIWNGTSWTEINDLSTSVNNGAPAHNSQAVNALYAGGATPPNTAVTQEWTADAALSTITVS